MKLTTYKHKYIEEECNNIFFTSDTHFGHVNILRYCNRPFEDIKDHDEILIYNWNKVVPENGIVYHLGDVGFGNSVYLNSIMKRLNGSIHLILGNHDMRGIVKQQTKFFSTISMQLSVQVGEQIMILNHCPMLSYPGASHRWWQLYGHVHSGPLSTSGLDIPKLKVLSPLQYDVGVDNNDFTPVSMQQVKEIIENQEKNFELAI